MKGRIIGIVALALLGGVWGCSEKNSQTIRMTVSDRGFVPAEITVKRGVPVTLLVTRETAATCATELVIQGAGVRKELPLHQEVSVTFTPKTKGELRYTCPMDMVSGSIQVE
ncbi:MAG TPA: cupredoxin domain-containing protein [Candidatus Eisenbacteria bacterium]|nr:cupredoxin domain-containing protein [Candidatus Eisenbacteria bacterium]